MSSQSSKMARCTCGAVEILLLGKPILRVACHCDDCQRAGHALSQLPEAPPVLDEGLGTNFTLYRKDRVHIQKGAENLGDHRFADGVPTRWVAATCCNAYMFLEHEKGHWFSIVNDRIAEDWAAPVLRIQTKFVPEGTNIPPGARVYRSFPFSFVGKLMLAQIAMMIRR